jgi:signal transduction histidine kinase
MSTGKVLLKHQFGFITTLLLLVLLSLFDIFIASRVIPNYPAVITHRLTLLVAGCAVLGLSITWKRHMHLLSIVFTTIFSIIRIDEVLHVLPRMLYPDLLLSLFIYSNFLALFIVVAFTNFSSSRIFALSFLVYAIVYELLYFRRMRELPPILFIMILTSTAAVALISNLIRSERSQKREISSLLEKEVLLRNSIALMKGRMLEQEKLFSLSMLTAGIAHELGNPINYVRGNLFFIKQYMQSLVQMIDRKSLKAEEQKNFDLICANYQSIIYHAEVGFDNITQIIDNMRKIYGNRRNVAERTNLKEMLTRTVDFFRVSHKSTSFSIQINIPRDLFCTLNQGEYYIVFTNLLVNALESLDQNKENGLIELHARSSEEGVDITIADNGCGITRELRDLIFDPFFSTKGSDSNLGLGLALCKEIVEADGSSISIEDKPDGQGTLVRICIRESQHEE